VGYRPRTVLGLTGAVRLERAYYHCRRCGRGVVPWDRALGLGGSSLTRGAQEALAMAAATDSFVLAADKLLRKLAGLRVSAATTRRVGEAVGQDIGRRLDAGEAFGPRRAWRWHKDADMKTCAYLSIDLTGVRMQGPGATAADGRMVAVAMVYNPVPEDRRRWAGPAGRAPKFQARYVAGLAGQAALGAPLQRQANRVGIRRAERWIALSDGGAGLEDLIRMHFQRVEVVVLDFYHAAEHLGDLARALYPQDEAGRAVWLKQWCHRLKHEGGQAVLDDLRAMGPTCAAPARETLGELLRYFGNQVSRMDYPRYLSHGWWIGSGPIESACKTVIGKRMKGGGMRWGEGGADGISHLRALICGGLEVWDDYWSCDHS
jgi:hypothetical protein